MDSLQELLNASVQNHNSNMYTAMPCIVVNVRDELGTQVVDIQLTVNQKQKDGTVSERPPILGVPVIFPASKQAAFTFPIDRGDTGLAVFSMRNLDVWKSGAGLPSTPSNQAKFDKGDAIFIPGLQTPNVAVNNPNKRIWAHSTRDTVMVNNIGQSREVEVRLKQNGDIILNTNSRVEVNCEVADIVANTSASIYTPSLDVQADNTNWFGNITLQGNLTHNGQYIGTGGYTFNGINFLTHVHGTSPPPSNP